MQPRLEILRRLVALYSTVEETHLNELQQMTAGVREVQQAIGAVQEVARLARADGRSALMSGDQTGSMVAEVKQEAAAWRRRSLEEVRVKRDELNEAAKAKYVASRLKKEQMKRVLDDVAGRAEVEEGRRTQAISDDRFLARRRWAERKRNVQSVREMKSP